ncbi:hypothetical protein GCK32_017892 [Trichostrongylus colubriformis]|uniref:Uncharacterized protein n=1 Tax=Trichostrongylus colubriformis TaxID=6319 RepID=A0AAN8EU56_TRICO
MGFAVHKTGITAALPPLAQFLSKLAFVLGFAVHKTGITAALPPLAQFLSKLAFGMLSDRIKCISERNKFRLFNSVAFLGSAFFLILLAFMGDDHKFLTNIVFVVFIKGEPCTWTRDEFVRSHTMNSVKVQDVNQSPPSAGQRF